ncbi:hypothetical protein FC34_GL001179 [Lacticaseibacillus brantae DSM 23927]|uniref:Peptidase C51 domain-containing protein n=1 Tax=Lacticaseibacillus brantae DSM 23927 TaxID=1423727 RepID=A0A0R2B9D0_9LACO|nr:hypothetical protein FC34_GL001179 [Lacticaseibacillus brantae DSM 23927]
MKQSKKHLSAILAAALLGLAGLGFSTQSQSVSAAQAGEVVTVNYVPGYGIALWNSPQADHTFLGRTLGHGTAWKVFDVKTVNGNTWYNLGGDQWIDGKYTVDGQVSQAPSAPDHSNQANAYPWGQCTYYVKMVAPWVGSYWGNGNQWGASAKREGYTVNNTPAAGAVVSFAAGQLVGNWRADYTYGHVAYVKSYNAWNNTITITQGGMGFSNPTGPNTQTIGNAKAFTYIHR